MNFTFGRHIALLIMCCTGLSGCEISALTQPPWPGKEAMQRFDFRRIDADPSIQAIDQVFYYYGASFDCGFDFTEDPAFAKFENVSEEKTAEAVGRAAWKIILAEVERQHPGYAGNPDIAQEIFEQRTVEKGRLGHAAPKLGGCDRLKEPTRHAMLAMIELGEKLLRDGNPKQPL